MSTSILNRLKRRENLAPDVYAALVDSLYGPLASLIGGAVGGVLCAVIIAVVTGSWAMYACAAIMTMISAYRVYLMKAYHARTPSTDPRVTAIWEKRYATGAIAFSGFLGVFCAFSILHMANPGVHLLVSVVTIGYASAISGRNAARPNVVVPQVLLSTGPLLAALIVHGDVYYGALAFMVALNFFAVVGIAKSIHKTLFAALDAKHENGRLVGMLDSTMRNMSHGLCMLDKDGQAVVWNPRFVELLGLPADASAAGQTLPEILRASGNVAEKDVAATVATGTSGGEIMLNLIDDQIISLTFRRKEDGGSVVVMEDITDRRRAEQAVEHLARFDVLTGLPNRTSFNGECGRILDRLRRFGGGASVLTLDLDHFKQVNDTLGHPVGDRLLRAVAIRLQGLIRPTDVVARFGGDEFVIVQTPVAHRGEAETLTKRIIEGLTGQYNIDEQQVIIGATVGIAMAYEDGATVDELIKNSDLALYRAKATSRGTAVFFEAEMNERAQNRRKLDLDLRAAIEQNGFELNFQPIVDLASQRTGTCEALIRWNHPVHGSVPPLQFIPIAEETGTIVPLGAWILREACRQAATWPGRVRVAVNLSPVQFRFRSLIDDVKAALNESGLEPSRLELEITESVLMQYTESASSIIDELLDIGVKLSLDDFGTGYSSLSYLHKIPFHKVKIDRGFVHDITENPASKAIVEAVGHIAQKIGMEVVAEGIEEAYQADAARDAGCTSGQGYLYSRPLRGDAVMEFLQREMRAAA